MILEFFVLDSKGLPHNVNFELRHNNKQEVALCLMAATIDLCSPCMDSNVDKNIEALEKKVQEASEGQRRLSQSDIRELDKLKNKRALAKLYWQGSVSVLLSDGLEKKDIIWRGALNDMFLLMQKDIPILQSVESQLIWSPLASETIAHLFAPNDDLVWQAPIVKSEPEQAPKNTMTIDAKTEPKTGKAVLKITKKEPSK